MYLLGSVHALKAEDYPLPKPFETAYQNADKTVFEVDMANASTYEATQLVLAKGVYTGSQSIETELSSETLLPLKAYLQNNRLPESNFMKLKPWMISLQVGVFELSKLGYQPELGVDLYYQQKAKKDGKPLLTLESFAQQIEVLSSDPPDIQALALRSSLESIDELPDQLGNLIQAWQHGDAERMYQITLAEYEQTPELKTQLSRLLDNRNVAMANKLREYLGTGGTYLVVVGTLHMGGDKGLLKLLGQDYKIKQFHYSAE